MGDKQSIDSVVISLIRWSALLLISLFIYDNLKDYQTSKIVLYWIMRVIVCIIALSKSISLVFYIHQPIKNRIVPAIVIAVFFFGFHATIHHLSSAVDMEYKMIESTFVDRSNMTYYEKIKLVNELREHFRTALVGSIRAGDCVNIDDFLNHLQITVIKPEMSHNQKVGAVATNYVLSHCRRRR